MISVAMATYNGERFIREQLESIVNQTILPDEIIVRDDRSTDRTLSIIEEYADRYKNIRWDVRKNPANKGFIKNFIGAILACNEEIILLCDQDDVWRSDRVEKFIEFFSDRNVVSLHSEIDIIDEESNIIRKSVLGYKKEKEKVSVEQFVTNLYYCGMSSAFRNSLLPQIETLDPDKIIIHDWLVHALAVCCEGFYKTNQVLTYRRFHYDNVALNLSKTERKGMEQRIDVVQYYCRHYSLLNELYRVYGKDLKKKSFIEKVLKTNQARLDYLKNRDFRGAAKNLRNIKYYPSPKAYASDLLYLTHIF